MTVTLRVTITGPELSLTSGRNPVVGNERPEPAFVARGATVSLHPSAFILAFPTLPPFAIRHSPSGPALPPSRSHGFIAHPPSAIRHSPFAIRASWARFATMRCPAAVG